MRYAIYSDVHAFPPALERVLADAAMQNVDERLCLGDVVGYGPDPVGAVRLCREASDAVVAGNHDAAVAGQISTWNFIPYAKEGVERHRSQLSDEDMEWLANLPMSVKRENFVAAHGEFHRCRGKLEAGFGYVLNAGSAVEAIGALPPGVDVAFVGHTHAACVWALGQDNILPRLMKPAGFTLEKDVRYVVNIGAVGYPRYHGETIYVIYDSKARSVEFRHIPFDYPRYVDAIMKGGIDLPTWIIGHMMGDVETSTDSRGDAETDDV